MAQESRIINIKRNYLIIKTINIVIFLYLLNALYWYLEGVPAFSTLIFVSAVMLMGVKLIKPTLKNLKLRTNLILGICFFSLAGLVLMTQQSSMIFYFWLFLTPLGSLIFLDRKGAVCWGIFLVVFVALSPFISEYFNIPNLFPENRKYEIETFEIVIAILTELFLLYIYRDLLFETYESLGKKRAYAETISKKLRQTQEFKDHFFANISHELRTPMNAIKGIAELLESNSEENEELITYLRNSSNHLLTIINDLLDFSKMQAGKLTLNNTQFNLRNAIYSSYNIVKVLALEKKLDYNLEIDSHLPEDLIGDPHRLTQILVNVLSNSAKYTKSGFVNIKCYNKSNAIDVNEDMCHIEFVIEDSGIGISKKVIKNLFENYYRVENEENITGTGLGLSITKNLIEAMNGTINIESELDKGTTVTIDVKLPIAHVENKIYDSTSKTINQVNIEMNVLIVDDNHLNTVVAKMQLEKLIPKTSQIYIAKNGQEAIEILEKNNIDIILMDMKMPVMNGIDATLHIRQMSDPVKRDVPIIAMTANVGENDVKSCFDSGMNAYISKPFEIYTLIHKMHKLLSERTKKSV